MPERPITFICCDY